MLRPLHLEAGLMGCGAAAMAGLGLYPSVAEAADMLNPVRDAFHPHPARADAYARRAERHRRLRSFALELAA